MGLLELMLSVVEEQIIVIVIGIFVNISHRKLFLQKLQESRRR